MKQWLRGGLLALILGTISALNAAELRVAAASNLQFVLPKLVVAFTAEHPDHTVASSFAASGSLVAQIRHGAPFDVFLSADIIYPEALIKSGHARADSLRVFAHGILMLWPHPGSDDWIDVLRDNDVRRIALAHHETAPYGRVTHAMLEAKGVWAQIAPKVIWGENIAQTLHFVHSGNADFGFVAASLLVADRRLEAGLIIAEEPLDLPQGAVRLEQSKHPEAANRFLDWLGEDAAQNILRKNGYRLP